MPLTGQVRNIIIIYSVVHNAVLDNGYKDKDCASNLHNDSKSVTFFCPTWSHRGNMIKLVNQSQQLPPALLDL